MTFISSNNSIIIEELSSCSYDFRTLVSTLVTVDTPTVDLMGVGTTVSPLSAAVKLSTNAKNLLTADSTGLLFNSDLLAGFMSGLKVSVTDGVPKSYVEDVLQAGTNITINKITTIGGEKLVINATSSAPSLTYADTSTIDLAGVGIVGDPLLASVKISTTAGNSLTANSTGLYVPTPSYTGESTLIATDSSTVSFGTSGTSGHSLTADVKLSNTVGNILGINGNGLYVPTPTFSQDPLVATDSNSINFTTTGANGHTLTADIRVSADSGNGLEIRNNGVFVAGNVNTPITVTPSESIEILTTGVDSHTLLPSLKVSAIIGNLASIVPDGLYVAPPSLIETPISVIDSPTIDFTVTGISSHTIAGTVKLSGDSGNVVEARADGLFVPEGITLSGTPNYVAKFSSSSTIGGGLIYDDGTKIVIGGTTGSSLFNVTGQGAVINTTTYTSGAATAFGTVNTTTFSGVLPTANASFSSHNTTFNSIFNGNTTVGGDTPFGSILAVSSVAFSSTGTVTMSNGAGGGLKAVAALTAVTFTGGNVNGTITKSAGIQINGIYQIAGATATITRTNHYQLLINDSNEHGHGGGITTKWGIYQIGSGDTNFFGGGVILNSLPVFADNSAASSLTTGTVYRDSTGNLKVKY